MAALDNVNSQIAGAFTSVDWSAVGLWLFIAVFAFAGIGWVLIYYVDKKLWNKEIKVLDIVGDYYEPVLSDVAKDVKIGKGGFMVLYLKKTKSWKIAYGGRVGKKTYYFFITKDGYWYNGMISANVNYIDQREGLLPVVTTNPNMRAQYTALEKQIDSLVGEIQNFWDEYGNWVLSFMFIVVAGLFLWLNARENAAASGQLAGAISEMAKITANQAQSADTLKQIYDGLLSNKIPISNSGFVPV